MKITSKKSAQAPGNEVINEEQLEMVMPEAPQENAQAKMAAPAKAA